MLDISPMLLIFTAIVFLALLIILNKVLYIPLLKFMESRDLVLQKDKENISKNEDDLLKYEQEAKEILQEAKEKALKHRNSVLEEVRADVSKKVEEKRLALEEEFDQFSKQLENEKIELKNGLLAQMPLFKEGIKAKLSQL